MTVQETKAAPPVGTRPASPGLLDMALESVLPAAAQTFLFVTLGSVATSLVGGLLQDKIPTPPPGLFWPSLPHLSWGALQQHKLWIIWAVFFALGVWKRRMECSPSPGKTQAALLRAGDRLSQNWFGIFVGNAFAASISSVLIFWLSQFSFNNWLTHFLLNRLQEMGLFQAGGLAEASGWDSLRALWDWFVANQLNFTFWSLFLTAVLDDLGLPNLKSWSRLLWRRLRPVTAPAGGNRPT